MVHRILVCLFVYGLPVLCLSLCSSTVVGQGADSVVHTAEDRDLFLRAFVPQVVDPEVTAVTAGETDGLRAVCHTSSHASSIRALATRERAPRVIGAGVDRGNRPARPFNDHSLVCQFPNAGDTRD